MLRISVHSLFHSILRRPHLLRSLIRHLHNHNLNQLWIARRCLVHACQVRDTLSQTVATLPSSSSGGSCRQLRRRARGSEKIFRNRDPEHEPLLTTMGSAGEAAFGRPLAFLVGCVQRPSVSTATPRKSRERIRMCRQPESHVIRVVGAGVAGLATALAVLHLDAGSKRVVRRVLIYDQAENETQLLADAGAALNLNGGVAVLQRLGLLERLRDAGITNSSATSTLVNGEGNERQLFRIDFSRFRDKARSLVAKDGKQVTLCIMRKALLALLLNAVLQDPRAEIKYGAKLKGCREDGVLEFADGSVSEPCTVCIGADGIRSSVRAFVLNKKIGDRPIYTNIRVVFAIGPKRSRIESHRADDAELKQYFSDRFFMLCFTGGCGPGVCQDIVALVFRDKSADFENPSYRRWDEEAVKKDALERIAQITVPADVRKCLQHADQWISIPVFQRRPIRQWSRGRYVLVGDAAHASAPFLGQGANQAIQDAYCLATELVSKLDSESYTDLEPAFRRYTTKRFLPTTKIIIESVLIGSIEAPAGALGVIFRNALFSMLGRLGVPEKVYVSGALPRV
ncbi:FAD-dependent urate hydroxylase [Porphyridium purpureum]|uniref:FAD-dependent urate hydroxylase n=1 Tax=Porphyridium purpureum TaxID=35688 RepID=A0A5J4Z6A9_PORPP|nr:FAD-dependent urate hydroxylase [Porphyridium purpureum]|eukprot:POR0731..scf295_1